jgi:Icc-related predicted phosphoesterase
MLACFTSDLHGSETLYAQLDELIARERPDLMLLGGDLNVDGDLADPVGTQVAYVRNVFTPRVQRWREMLPQMAVAVIAGNHEWACTYAEWQRLADAGLIHLLNLRKPIAMNGMHILGYGLTPPTPFYAKDFERLDCDGEAPPPPDFDGYFWDSRLQRPVKTTSQDWFRAMPTLERDLKATPAPPAPWLFVCHAPPHATNLDRMKGLSEPVGSRAVREFIETHQPVMTLHGHIHESPRMSGAFRQQLGQSLCVNPGQTTERLHAVLFDLRDPVGTLRHTVYG